jgi:hypothetical protein
VLVIQEAEALKAVIRVQNGEMEEAKRRGRKAEIFKRTISFDWIKNVNPSPIDPIDMLTETNTIVLPSAAPTV